MTFYRTNKALNEKQKIAKSVLVAVRKIRCGDLRMVDQARRRAKDLKFMVWSTPSDDMIHDELFIHIVKNIKQASLEIDSEIHANANHCLSLIETCRERLESEK